MSKERLALVCRYAHTLNGVGDGLYYRRRIEALAR